MANDDRHDDGEVLAPVASGAAEHIPWAHPLLEPLGQAARVIYACLVDGRSEPARATLRGVDVVWRNRFTGRRDALLGPEAHATICSGVQELLDAGLVILRSAVSVQDAWVRRPWEAASLN